MVIWLILGALLMSACTAASAPLDPADPNATARPADPTEAAVASPTPTSPTSPLGPDIRVLEFAPGQTVGFVIGEEDLSWSIAVSAQGPDDLVGIRQVTDPAGERRYLADLRNELLIVDDLHPVVLADAGAVGVFGAGDPGQRPTAGRWEVEVVGNAGPPAVRVAIRSGAIDVPQTLDVAVWVTASDVDMAAVADSWRQQMDAVLSPHGIRIGRLDMVPGGPAGAEFAALGVDGLADEVHRACTAMGQATGAPPRSALLILADQIGEGVMTADTGSDLGPGGIAYRQPDGTIDGFAVATPGTPVLGPTSHACVAVSVGEDPGARGLVALHELLHQTGVTRHTTERNGRDFDHLDDTPECAAADYDVDLDLQVTRGECASVDADNLMFWAIGGQTLTTDQTWLVRAHPLLHPAGQQSSQ